MKNRILYAEDDEILAFLTQDNLELNGYVVTHCADGNACSESFAIGKFDICILDIMLPKKDGFELAKAIRQVDPEIPILILSAKSLMEDRTKGFKIGADDFLVKPFTIEELLQKLEFYLQK